MKYPIDYCENEEAFISAMHNGDERALNSLFNRFHHSLVYFATQYLSNTQAAEDIVAESFGKIWKRKTDFKSLPAIKSFLYTTVKNACLNQLKQNSRYTTCHEEIKYLAEQSEELYSEQKMIKSELLARIWQCADQLPPIRRKIFKLMFWEGLTSFEIARLLKVSVDTVRVQKARALHALKKLMKA